MFTYLPLPSLPSVPEKFIDLAIEISQRADLTTYVDPSNYKAREVVKDGKTHVSRRQLAVELGPDWDQWVRENIVTDFSDTGVRICFDNGSSIQGPHVDRPFGKYKIYYLITPGGEKVVTSWYKEKNCPLFRERNTVVNDYSYLEIVDSIQIPTGRWILFNTNILHDVTGLESTRMNLVVTLPNSHEFVQRFI